MINPILLALTDQEILWLTLIGETRGEPIESQVATGSVIRNRMQTQKKTYTQICLAPEQFSCWNKDDPNYLLLIDLAQKMQDGDMQGYEQLYWVAEGIVQNLLKDNTKDAHYYMTKELFNTHPPSWAAKPINLITYGKQVYFNI
jgi:N-acetylmuramoyl-L-alanine amidase